MKKHPGEGSENNLKVCVYKGWERKRPHAFCIMSLRLTLTSEVKLRTKPKRKRVLIARLVRWSRPEAG